MPPQTSKPPCGPSTACSDTTTSSSENRASSKPGPYHPIRLRVSELSNLTPRARACVCACSPKSDDLKPYLASLDRLVAASEALRKTDSTPAGAAAHNNNGSEANRSRAGQAATLAQMAQLIDSGAKQLVGVFTKWLKETSHVVDAGKLLDQGARAFSPLSSGCFITCADSRL